jgi:integrase/recombinase XerD
MGTATAPWKKGLEATKKGWTADARHHTDFNELHRLFMERCTREGLAQGSRDLYDANLAKLYDYLRDVCGRKYWQKVTRDDVNSFIEHYQAKKLSEHTKHQVFRNIKTLMKWMEDDPDCEKSGLVPHLKAIPKLKHLQGRIYLPSPPELQKFIESFDKDSVWGFRDYVVSVLILGCGARVGEICNMVLDDIKWDMGMVRLFGKGKKERIVPVEGDEIFPLLKKWLLVRERYASGNGEDRLFVNRAGGMCQPNTFDQSFNKHRRRTGLGNTENGSLSPHILRHFFCTYYLVDGGDIEKLQRITGHEDIQTLMNYVHLANQLGAVKDDHSRVSPLKSLRKRAGGAEGEFKKKRKMS